MCPVVVVLVTLVHVHKSMKFSIVTNENTNAK